MISSIVKSTVVLSDRGYVKECSEKIYWTGKT